MNPITYLNGEYRSALEAQISVTDWGFVQGITLAEQLRTFGGVPFQLKEHLQRLAHGLQIVGWQDICSMTDLVPAIEAVVKHNRNLCDEADDLGVTVLITPGTYPAYQTAEVGLPTICVHTYLLPFHLWSEQYIHGQVLKTVAIRQVPAECWPPDLKCRSRMHYYLATQQARRIHPRATALLLDTSQRISETPTSNVVGYFRGLGIVSPPARRILPGISLRFLQHLAGELGIPWSERDLTVAELSQADEVLVTSTPFCVLPVAEFDNRQWPSAGQGPIYQQLLEAWNRAVGLEIPAQATRFASR